LLAETCRTAATARLLQLPAAGAWRRWKWKNFWKKKGINIRDSVRPLKGDKGSGAQFLEIVVWVLKVLS
jgi:hypothetical protein